MTTDFKAILDVGRILSDLALTRLEASYSRQLITDVVRQYLNELRARVANPALPLISKEAASMCNICALTGSNICRGIPSDSLCSINSLSIFKPNPDKLEIRNPKSETNSNH